MKAVKCSNEPFFSLTFNTAFQQPCPDMIHILELLLKKLFLLLYLTTNTSTRLHSFQTLQFDSRNPNSVSRPNIANSKILIIIIILIIRPILEIIHISNNTNTAYGNSDTRNSCQNNKTSSR